MSRTSVTSTLRHLPLRPVALAAAAALLAGCSLIPAYQRPAAPVAPQWPATAGALPEGGTAAADLPWQDFVQDAQLRELISLALANNRDLRVAVQNIEAARAQYQIRRADQVPSFNATAGFSRSAPSALAAFGAPRVSQAYSVGVAMASWEIDFFGRVDALKEQALAQYLATEEARKSAQISLVANVASAWLTLKTDTELLALAERTLGTRQQTLQLTKLRFDNGASSALDLRQAESLSATAAATRAQQQRLRAQDINLLTLLVGQAIPDNLIPLVPAVQTPPPSNDASQPTPLVQPAADLPGFAQVPAGLPSDLLLRRPDVRAAEEQLIAANANIGAARAAFFPRISLTASLGHSSRELDNLFQASSRAWAFAPSLVLPIFDFGRNQANLDAARAQREIALANYEKAIQTAFREVADALAGRATLADQYGAMQAQAEADRDRFRLSDLRYRNGVSSYLDLLDAQRSLFTTEQTLAQVRLQQRANDVLLYKALGGGWTEPPAPAAAAAAPASQ